MTRWVLWIAFVILWTAAVEMPVPQREELPAGDLILTYRKVIAKTVHVLAYVLLAATASLLPALGRYRALMMFFLIGHAWLTEWLQELLYPICFRGGSLADVGINLIGIILGVAITWKWWTSPLAA